MGDSRLGIVSVDHIADHATQCATDHASEEGFARRARPCCRSGIDSLCHHRLSRDRCCRGLNAGKAGIAHVNGGLNEQIAGAAAVAIEDQWGCFGIRSGECNASCGDHKGGDAGERFLGDEGFHGFVG